ncbi:hypothetical protein ACP70R_030836 [Stipagrostis hirtigluma subsp. patula]
MLEDEYRYASEKARRSVVTVVRVDPSNAFVDRCVGCVILNSAESTFIMTAAFMVGDGGSLQVHFDDDSTKLADVLLTGEWFAILTVQRHKACQAIHFREMKACREEVIVLAPISYQMPHIHVNGFVVAPSIIGKDGQMCRVEESKSYFLITCPCQDQGQLNQNRLISSPVFDTLGNAFGIIYDDCGVNKLALRLVKRALHIKDLPDLLKGMHKMNISWQEALRTLDKTRQESFGKRTVPPSDMSPQPKRRNTEAVDDESHA